VEGLQLVGLALPQEEAQHEFDIMDSNSGGYVGWRWAGVGRGHTQGGAHSVDPLPSPFRAQVLFDEFAAWVACKSCPVDDEVHTAYTKASVAMAKSKAAHRTAAEASAEARRQRAADMKRRREEKPETKYGGVEEKIGRLCRDPKKLKLVWRKLDRSADGSASLKELQDFMVGVRACRAAACRGSPIAKPCTTVSGCCIEGHVPCPDAGSCPEARLPCCRQGWQADRGASAVGALRGGLLPQSAGRV
jgi:hypothetical protein